MMTFSLISFTVWLVLAIVALGTGENEWVPAFVVMANIWLAAYRIHAKLDNDRRRNDGNE